jgi:hypothetical protein
VEPGYARRVLAAWRAGAAPGEVGAWITVENAAVRALRGFAAKEGVHGLCLLEGEYGEGKSHLLRLVVEEARKRGRRAGYVECAAETGFGQTRRLLLKLFGQWGVEVESHLWMDAEGWFRLARVAKERFPDQFSPREREFTFKIGVYMANGWSLSEKQMRWAEEIVAQAVACGASEKLTERVWAAVADRGSLGALGAVDETEVIAEGGAGRLRGFVQLLRRIVRGELPMHFVVAVTPEVSRVLSEQGLRDEEVLVVRVPRLAVEEAAEMAEVAMDVFERAGGRARPLTTGTVKALLARYPTRRAFLQGLVLYLEGGT